MTGTGFTRIPPHPDAELLRLGDRWQALMAAGTSDDEAGVDPIGASLADLFFDLIASEARSVEGLAVKLRALVQMTTAKSPGNDGLVLAPGIPDDVAMLALGALRDAEGMFLPSRSEPRRQPLDDLWLQSALSGLPLDTLERLVAWLEVMREFHRINRRIGAVCQQTGDAGSVSIVQSRMEWDERARPLVAAWR